MRRFGMDAQLQKINPFRRLQWRADRVLELVGHRPKPLPPRRQDDHYDRAYHRLLLLYLSAPDAKRQSAAVRELPAVYDAHRIHFHPDPELRTILEARLLTREPFADIAGRFAAEPAVIEYYEKLFFNVTDRLDNTDWIMLAALRRPPDRQEISTTDVLGYVYRALRLFRRPAGTSHDEPQHESALAAELLFPRQR